MRDGLHWKVIEYKIMAETSKLHVSQEVDGSGRPVVGAAYGYSGNFGGASASKAHPGRQRQSASFAVRKSDLAGSGGTVSRWGWRTGSK